MFYRALGYEIQYEADGQVRVMAERLARAN
jgi:hypothetical protein